VQYARTLGAAAATALLGVALFGTVAAAEPWVAGLFAQLLREGPGLLGSLPAPEAGALRDALAAGFRAAFLAAAQGPMKKILDYNTAPLVSSDFNHSPASCTFDATQTQSVDGGGMVRVMGWYDNEWGFSNRMSDTAAALGRL